MFIETAFKNISLQYLLEETNASSFAKLFDIAIPGYAEALKKGKAKSHARSIQQQKMNLHQKSASLIANAYQNGSPIITNFLHNRAINDIPIWAVFEIMTFGEFGFMIKSLDSSITLKISDHLNLDKSNNTDGSLFHRYIFIMKDLRNAIAHNSIIYDNRFQNKIDNSVFNSLSKDTSIQQIEFKFFVDYIILTTCILKKLGISKNELKLFVNSFINGTENFRQQIPASLFMSLCGSDCNKKSKELHNYIKI